MVESANKKAKDEGIAERLNTVDLEDTSNSISSNLVAGEEVLKSLLDGHEIYDTSLDFEDDRLLKSIDTNLWSGIPTEEVESLWENVFEDQVLENSEFVKQLRNDLKL